MDSKALPSIALRQMAHDEIKCFVFTDIVSSTRLKSQMSGHNNVERDREFAGQILEPHRKKILAELDKFSGRMISTQGDGHFLVFSSPLDATLWAINVQQSHQDDPIETPDGEPVGIKIGIHWGQATIDPSDASNFIGRSIDFAARIVDFGSPGQILASRTVSSLVESEEIFGVELFNHGNREMRGIGLKPVYEILYGGKEPSPLKNEGQVTHGTTQVSSPTDTIRTFRIPKPTPTDVQAGMRLGKYRLMREIGAGGMGKVYLAKHVGMDRTCVIKLIRSSLLRPGNEEIISRFYREIQILASIDHPNVVGAYDSSSENDDVHYLVMEYVDGISLDKALHRLETIPLADACEVIRQAAIGLQYIHEQGLVHRDIKPSNLMLTSKKSQPIVKVLDLGLALLINDAGNRITQVEQRAMGTGHYMAPEQWKSTNVDIRADIYSLGCTLYHLVAGKPPFEGSRFTQQHAHQSVSPPRIERADGVPEQLQAVLQQMMAKNPEERFSTPIDVVDALAEPANQHRLNEVFSRAYKVDSSPDAIVDATPPIVPPSADTIPHESAETKTKPWWPDAARPWWLRRSLWTIVAILIVAVGIAGVMLSGGSLTEQQRQLSDDMGTLPGLNGDWWFRETPWFVPGLRQELIRSIEDGEIESEGLELEEWLDLTRGDNSDNIVALHLQLQNASTKLVRLIDNDVEKAVATELLEIDTEVMNDDTFDKMLDELVDRLVDVETATGCHLRAVLLHRRDKPNEAEEAYKKAITLYKNSVQESGALLALCHADLAQLYLENKNYYDCRTQSTSAREINNAPAFVASCFLVEAKTRREEHQLDGADEKLDYADRRLNGETGSPGNIPSSEGNHVPVDERTEDQQQGSRNTPLPLSHPLRAAVHELRAQVLLDRWKLDLAIDQLNKAISIRTQNQALLDGNPRSERYLLFTQQLKSTAEHFSGHQMLARTNYLNIADTITESIRNPTMTSRQLIELSERRPNLYERLGDCALFGSPREYSQAKQWYYQAIDHADDLNFQNDYRWPHICRIRFKLALACLYNADEEEAKDALNDAQEMYRVRGEASPGGEVSSGQHRQYQDAERVMVAAMQLLESSTDEEARLGAVSLLTHLESVKPRDARDVNRKNIRLLLMESELALSSDQLDAKEALAISRKLQTIGNGIVHRSEGEFSGEYFREYYEAARDRMQEESENPQLDSDLQRRLLREFDNLNALLGPPEM